MLTRNNLLGAVLAAVFISIAACGGGGAGSGSGTSSTPTGDAQIAVSEGVALTITNGSAAANGRDFGTQAVSAGPTGTLTITLQNQGTDSLTLGTPALSGPDAGDFVLSLGSFASPVAPTAQTTFGIAFDPTSTGTKTASVSFTHNGNNTATPFTFGVMGTGVSTPPPSVTPNIAVAGPASAVSEGDSGTTNATFSVTLSQATSLTVTVGYQTQPGTANPATSGGDYIATMGTLTFTSGQTSKTVDVPVVGDTAQESNETFDLVLNSPSNGTITTGTATCTINDDDSPGGGNRVVMAYAENIWGAGGATAVQNFDYSAITHVIHGFVLPDANGGLTEHANFSDFRTGAGWMPQNLPDAVHAAGRKIVFSIGGALPSTNATNFAAIAADSAKRQTFINNVISRLNTWGYDGVDIDYEWPVSNAQGQDFTTLMSELYAAVKANNANHLVMFGAGPGDKIGYKEWSQLANHCDYCFFFGYDWHWGFPSPHPIGPITNPGVSFFPSSTTGSIERSVRGAVNYVLGQGFPANQLVIGLPFYSDTGTTWSGGGRADWLGLTQAQRQAAVNSNYMEALINGKYWTTPEAIDLKLEALLDSGNTVLRDAANNPVTAAGIGWWEWGNENPGHGELTAAIKAWLAANP